MKKIITDGGKAKSGFTHERNDCTVRALAMAGGIPYEVAHRIMAEEGRREGGGGKILYGLRSARNQNLLMYDYVDLSKHLRTYNAAPGFVGANNKPILCQRMVGPTVRQFIEEHPTGRYIVGIKRHVFAVINGKMYDAFKQHGGALVKSAYKIAPVL